MVIHVPNTKIHISFCYLIQCDLTLLYELEVHTLAKDKKQSLDAVYVKKSLVHY